MSFCCEKGNGKVPESISICYEETFSHLIREDRLKGAKLLINLTNDAWYPSSTLPLQHFYHGKVRALENGVPLVRACNSGVTAAVDSLGRVIGIFQGSKGESQWEQGPLFASLSLYSYTTLYSLVGNAPLLFLSLSSISSFLLCRKKTLASNRSTL
ncbi:MAG: hypothetical protein HYZ47_03605 [Simkania negevensis]|nr:hypothetical protein [Simkania negevensis]